MPLRKRHLTSTSLEEADQSLSLREKISAILKSERLINGIMLLAIVVGFFHGWLKLKFPNPITTFLFDGLLLLPLVLPFFKNRGGPPFFLPPRLGKALLAFYILCFFYMFMPGGPPLIVALSAFRGWC